MIPWLSLTIFAPLAGSVVIALVPRERVQLTRWLAFATTIISFACSVAMIPGFSVNGAGFQYQEDVSWIPAFGIHYRVGVDGISLILILLTTLLTSVSVLASFRPIRDRVKEYMISFLILEVGMVGVFAALDLFLFYIFWETVLVPMYLIIGIWGGANRIYATIKFVLYTLVGSLLMLVAILATAYTYQSATGSWMHAFDFEYLRSFAATVGFAEGLQVFAFLAFFLAFAIKVPMFPFHTWLPDAHVEAPTAGSVILAGVLLKMGTYGFIRFSLPLLPQATLDAVPWVATLSIIAIVYAGLVTLVQKDMKKLVAYSSVSHLGFVMLGMFALNPLGLEGSVLQMVNHGLSTGGLFLLVGLIYERRHTKDIAQFGGLASVMPVYATFALILFLASMGLPLLNGFVGEFMILQGAFAANRVWAYWAVTGVVLGAAYLLWLYQRVFWGKVQHEENQKLKDLGAREVATLVPLVALCFWIGVYPKPFLEFLHQPAARIAAVIQPGKFAAAARADARAASAPAAPVASATPSPAAEPLPASR